MRTDKLDRHDSDVSLPTQHQFRLCVMAVLLGALSYPVAILLLKSIDFFTQLFYFHKFSLAEAKPEPGSVGVLSIFVPSIGGVVVGLMARFGSTAIRGHGIPEAMEKVLLDESKIPKRVLLLKPISSAIAIGSGGAIWS